MWPVDSASEIRQRALSVPWVCCEMPMPQKIIARSAFAYRRAMSRISSGATPQAGAMASGVIGSTWALSASKPSVWAAM